MTVKEYMEGLEATSDELKTDKQGFTDVMMESARIWSNNACRGYCIDAMQRAGYSREQIADALRCLNASFHSLTTEEAEQVYNQF